VGYKFSHDFELAINTLSKENDDNNQHKETITGVYSFNDDRDYIRANLYHAQRNLEKDNSKRIIEEKNFSLGVH